VAVVVLLGLVSAQVLTVVLVAVLAVSVEQMLAVLLLR